MSFTYQVKEEILKRKVLKEDFLCILYGVLFSKNTVKKDRIYFKTENYSFIKYLIENIDKYFKVNLKLTFQIAKNFKKHREYKFEISNKDPQFNKFYNLILDVDKLKDTRSLDHILIGYFLAYGYIKDPNKSYSVDFFIKNEYHSKKLIEILKSRINKATLTKSRSRYIIYVRSKEDILDLLNILQAMKSFFQYQAIAINKEVKKNVVRSMNYEIYNETKKQKNINETIEMIEYIDNTIGIQSLKPILQEVCNYRKSYNNLSLSELALKISLTKSGLRGRLNQIKEIYLQLKEKEKNG